MYRAPWTISWLKIRTGHWNHPLLTNIFLFLILFLPERKFSAGQQTFTVRKESISTETCAHTVLWEATSPVCRKWMAPALVPKARLKEGRQPGVTVLSGRQSYTETNTSRSDGDPDCSEDSARLGSRAVLVKLLTSLLHDKDSGNIGKEHFRYPGPFSFFLFSKILILCVLP